MLKARLDRDGYFTVSPPDPVTCAVMLETLEALADGVVRLKKVCVFASFSVYGPASVYVYVAVSVYKRVCVCACVRACV
jgi:phage-related baseplate assembly protein